MANYALVNLGTIANTGTVADAIVWDGTTAYTPPFNDGVALLGTHGIGDTVTITGTAQFSWGGNLYTIS
jgi:hypothetical protein